MRLLNKGNLLLILLLYTLFAWQCRSTKSNKPDYKAYLDTLSMEYSTPIYQASVKRDIDILHTRLDLKFDIPKATVIGNATLTLKPYFYETNIVKLDAVGFTFTSIFLQTKSGNTNLNYEYDGFKVLIKLNKTYTQIDTLNIVIEYVAKPEETISSGSGAITNDQGLYFINKDGKSGSNPTQIWSQGETQSNSKWFPTIDAPNERMTQEIYLTVAKNYTTLSNGLLLSQKENNDGTRTDYWKQSLPAAPYLTMIAVGNFAVVKDKYKNKEVSYYVEPAYAKYAKQIFGNTPEMIGYFSDILGVDYAWEKYAQIAVREYVSGAMENTTATVHGDDIQRTEKELIDDTGEDIIAHELFHHWFGDLVTCESWSNLPLNESFANYSEYLWLSHKYGKDAGDDHLNNELDTYFAESKTKSVNLIRYYFLDKEDMFDAHSYSKGGRVLHMLRNYVGDEAFFAALKLYLETKRFDSAEIADLRLAFEKVTGEDLNWFFDQWFLASGHPELSVTTEYDTDKKEYKITVNQNQNFSFAPLYKLPLKLDFYTEKGKTQQAITITKQTETFVYPMAKKADLVVFDADHVLLGTVDETKSIEEWVYQYKHAQAFFARMQAVKKLGALKGKVAYTCLIEACSDKFYSIRTEAASVLYDNYAKENPTLLKSTLLNLAQKDEKSDVRANALLYWFKMNKGEDNTKTILQQAIKDKSYLVQSVALNLLFKADQDLGFEMAKKFDADSNIRMVSEVARIYTALGTENENDYFVKNFNRISGFSKYDLIDLYGKFLLGQKDEIINSGIVLLEQEARFNTIWYNRLNATNKLNNLLEMYSTRAKELQSNAAKKVQYEATIVQKEKLKLLIADINKKNPIPDYLKYFKE